MENKREIIETLEALLKKYTEEAIQRGHPIEIYPISRERIREELDRMLYWCEHKEGDPNRRLNGE